MQREVKRVIVLAVLLLAVSLVAADSHEEPELCPPEGCEDRGVKHHPLIQQKLDSALNLSLVSALGVYQGGVLPKRAFL